MATSFETGTCYLVALWPLGYICSCVHNATPWRACLHPYVAITGSGSSHCIWTPVRTALPGPCARCHERQQRSWAELLQRVLRLRGHYSEPGFGSWCPCEGSFSEHVTSVRTASVADFVNDLSAFHMSIIRCMSIGRTEAIKDSHVWT